MKLKLDRTSGDTDSRTWKMRARKQRGRLKCSLCPPHRGENVTRSKRGAKKQRRRT